MSSRRALATLLLLSCAVLFPTFASAALVEFRVLVDADHQASTGCTVSGMQGVDHMLVTRVDVTETGASVQSSYRMECPAGVFGAQLDPTTAGWEADLRMPQRHLWFETRMPYSAFGGSLPVGMRFGFEAKLLGSSHTILTKPNGQAILFPPTSVPRRRSTGDARAIVMDGSSNDWGEIPATVRGNAQTGNESVRVLKVFLFGNGNDDQLYFGFDAYVSSDFPFAQDDDYSRKPGEGLDVAAPGVLGNDGDPNGAPLTALPVVQTKHGDVVLRPDGSFTYSPDNPNNPRTDSFEYKANNGTKDSNVARVKIKVSFGNDAPVGVDDHYTGTEDVQLAVPAPGVLTNDTDPDGDELTAALLAAPSHGTVALNANGGFTYNPQADFFGTDSFTYTLSDGEETDTAKVTITVESANDDPVAFDVSVTTNEEQAVAVTLSATDPEGDPLTYNVVNPANGVLTGTAPNLTYTPNLNFFGTDTFTYTVTDGSDVSNVATVTITVNPVNDPPFFTSGGNVTSAEDVAYNAPWATGISPGAPNETSQTLTFNITNNTNPGLFASGPAISASGVLTFTPALNANGSADITVTLSDNAGGANTSAPATFTITITPVNDPPAFTSGGNVTVLEDSGAYSNAWATGISAGPADESGQTLTFNITNNTNPGLFASGPAISASGVLTFTPALNMFGSADITVTLSDNGGGTNTSAPVTFTITVTGVNDEPSFTSGGNVTVFEDSNPYSAAWATAITAGPFEGTQTLTFNVTNNTNPGLFLTAPAIDAAGFLTFALNANANGSADITVELKDNGGTANSGDDTSAPVTFTINVTAVNDAPSFTSGGNVTVNEDGPAYNSPWATSISKGPADENTQTLTFNITGNTNPGLFATGPAIDAAGNLSFTLNANLNGSSDITVTLSDNGGGTDTSAPVTFTINVTPVNDEPTFTSGGNVTSNEDTPYSAAWATGISKGPADESSQTLTFNVTNNTNAGLFQTGPSIDASGNLSYTPALNAFGSADITVNLTDSGSNIAPNDNTSASVTFTITIISVNDAPVITAGNTVGWNENAGPVTLSPALTITDVDSVNAVCVAANDCYVFISGNPDPNDVLACPGCAGQGITANWTGSPSFILSLTGNVSLGNYQNAMRTVTFDNTSDTPSQSPRGIDWFIKDDLGAQNADTLLNDTTVNVTAVNDAPSNTVPGAQVTDEDFAITFSGNISISDPDAGTSPVKVNLVATSGTLTLSGTTGLTFTDGDGSGDVTMEFTGSITDINAALNGMVYSPTPDFNGAGSVSILTNDQGNTGTGGALSSNGGVPNVVAITINPINDEPSFVSGGDVTVNEDSSAYSAAWATSISKGPADENGQTLTFNITGNTNAGLFASGPAIDASGNLTFTLNANLNGSADITVTLSDDGSNVSPNDNVSAPVTFTITVDPVNDEPSFTSGGNVTSNEDEAYSAAWATGISKGPADESGQTLTFNVTVDTNPGLFLTPPAIDASGNLTYTPAANANGVANITVYLTDSGSNTPPSDNQSASVSFTITVDPINDPPSFVSGGNVTVNEDSSAYNAAWATSLSKGPADENGQTLTAFNVTGNTNPGLFASGPSIDPGTGFLSFTLNANVNGSSDITVTLSDNGSNVSPNDNTSDPVTFTITVDPVNDEPTFNSGGNVTSNEDEAYSAAWATGISKGPADESTQTLTFNITNNTNAGLFQSGPSIDASGNLTYTPAADANGSADITVNLTDDGSNVPPNDNTSASVTFTITITAINDPPTFVSGGNVTVDEDSGAYSAAWATSISKGPADESGQTLTFNITGNTNAGLFASGPAIDASGNLTFTLNANLNGSADITVTLSDDGSNVSPNDNVSDPVTFTITVTAVNDEPSFTSGGDVATNEDTPFSAAWATGISKGPADESGQTLTFNVTNNSNPGLFLSGPSITAAGVLSFTPAANANGSASITVNLTDDGSNVPPSDNTSASATFTITVNAVNDEPSFTIAGDPPYIGLNAGPQTVAGFATLMNDGDPELTQTLTFNETVTGTTGGLTFSTPPSIDETTGDLTYAVTNGTQGTATVSVTLSDNGSNVAPNDNISPAQVFTIVVEVGPTVTSTTPLEGATTVSPTDDIVINFSEPVSIDAGGLTINCGGAQAYTATPVAGGFSATHTFNPNSNLPSTTCVVTLTATAVHDQDTYDGPDNLPGDFTLNFTVNTPPVANNDVENALGNLQLVVSDANGVIDDGGNDDDDGTGGNDATDGKDIDPDPGAVLTIQNLGPLTGTAGGTLTFTAGGGYTYISEAGDQNVDDVFTYTLVDNNGATDTATLTIHVGQRYIFCDDTGVPGDGRSTSPFHTLQAAQAGSTTNDKIIVYAGTYTDFITLQSGQHLIGQGIDANLTDTFNGDTFTVLTSGASPSLARSTAGATITLGSNNTIRGVLVGSSAGAAISGNGFGTLTVNDDLDVNAAGGPALNLTTGTVAGTFDVLSATSGASSALSLTNVDGTVAAVSGALSSTTGTTINISGGTHALTYPGTVSTTGTAVFTATGKTGGTTTLSGGVSGSGGVNISTSTGATFTFTGLVNISTGTTNAVVLGPTFGAVNFNGGLQITTTTAATGFSATGGGTLSITGATNTISTGAATTAALLMNGITLTGATFNSVTSSGAATGVSLTSLGNGNVTINGGTINGGTTGYSLTTLGTSTVTLAGVSIGNVTPPTTAISGTTFGTLAISGAAVNVTGVTALTLSGGAMSGTFNNVTATAGNVSLTNITSAAAWGATAGSITGTAAAPAFNVSGGTSSINWGGTISQALANRVISIAGGHATGTINFNNTVSSTGVSTGAIFTASSGTYNLNGTGPAFTNTFSSTDNAATAITISNGEAGNISFSTGTTITATGHSFHVDGSVNPVTTVINYRGTINKASGGSFITVNNLDTPGSLNMTRGAPNTPASGDLTMNNNGGSGISVTNCDNAAITISNASLTYNNVAAGFAASANTGTTAINLPGLFLDGNGNKAGMLISGAGTITVNAGAANPTIDLSGGSAAASRAIDGTTTSFTGTLNLTNATITGNANADIVTLTGSTLGGSGSTISGANDALVLSGVTLTTGAGMSSVTSTGGTNGISLTNTSGATAVSPYTIGGGSLSGNTGAAFNVSTGTANFSYGGSITQNTAGQRAVNITGITGGVITLSGAVNSSGGNGINLTGTGGTVNITGLITLNNTGATFTASGAGLTISASNTGNTIGATTAATGPAISVTSSTIGAANLNFQKVSSSGGANGIMLNGTGSSGRLIIAGNGGACSSAATCTGGAIQNTTGHGVSLTSTLHPSFTRVYINNTSGSGVFGSDVTNFTYQFGKIENSGTGLGAETSNIGFNTQSAGTENNLDGSVTITDNTLLTAYYHGIDIYNHSGTITDVNLSNNIITSTTSTVTSKGSGIRLVAFGGAGNVGNVNDATIDNNVISNFPSGAGIVAQGGNANNAGPSGTYGIPNDANNIISITNNRIAGSSAAIKMNTHAIQGTVNGKGQGNFYIGGNGTVANPLTNIGGNVISHSSLGATTVTSVIENNVIVANHTPDFGGPIGISVGSGITAGITGSGALTTRIEGNTVSLTDGPGIQARSAEGTATMVIKLIDNTVGAPQGTGASYGIRVESGGASATDNNVCLEITGNTSAGEGGVNGIGLRKQGTVATTHDFGIEGLSPSPNTLASQVINHVNSLNPSGGGTDLVSAQTGFTSCTAP